MNIKLLASMGNAIAKRKDSEGEHKGLKSILIALTVFFFLIIAAVVAPLAAIAGIFSSDDGSNVVNSKLYDKVNAVLEDKISAWETQGTENIYPDIAMGFAYFSTEGNTYELKDLVFNKGKLKTFYDSTVNIGDNVVVKDVASIASSNYPDNPSQQQYYNSAYSYWLSALKNVTLSATEIPSEDVTTTVSESQSLSDVSVTVYSTGMPIPHYLQYDTQWGGVEYGASTIASAGCGPTCAAMVISYYTQSYVTPVTASDYAQTNGYHTELGTAWDYFSNYAATYGVTCENLGMDMDRVKSELMAGHAVISSMGPGTFTKKGHFIVLRGMDEEGNIYVNDPNDNFVSKAHYTKVFSPNLIYSEAKNFWSFSK